MPSTTSHPGECLAKATSDSNGLFERDIQCLQLAMERGSVSMVRWLLHDQPALVRTASTAGGMIQLKVSKAVDWLAEAIKYEEKHGPRSVWDAEHPLNKVIDSWFSNNPVR